MYQVAESINRDLIGKSEDEIMDMFDCSDAGIDACTLDSDQYADLFIEWVAQQGIKIVRM